MHRIVLLALALSTCNLTPSSPPDDDDETEGDELAERELPLPDLPHVGVLAPGPYLFPRSALGSGEGLAPAELVRVEADAFVISIDGGPHRSVARTEGWPMACMASPLEHAEGALSVRLAEGAPVFVLASTRDAARVSVGLSSAQSRVVRRDAITLEGCLTGDQEEGEASVASTPEGDAACLFPDQESLDGSGGLPIPLGAPVRVVEEDGEWARVEVGARGGSLRGWMSANLVASDAPIAADWIGVALRTPLCVFPGRPEPRRPTIVLEGDPEEPPAPAIPAIEIERVFRMAMPGIQACYAARLNEVPDLRVTLEVLLLVDVDGRVSDATLTRGANADAALTRCILERMRRLRFPAPRTGTMNVRRTFQLTPPAESQGSGE